MEDPEGLRLQYEITVIQQRQNLWNWQFTKSMYSGEKEDEVNGEYESGRWQQFGLCMIS